MTVVVGEPIPVDGKDREALVAEVEAFLRRELGVDAVPARAARVERPHGPPVLDFR